MPKPSARLPAVEPTPAGSLKPLRPHDLTTQAASARVTLRRRQAAQTLGPAGANHARHHVPRSSQA